MTSEIELRLANENDSDFARRAHHAAYHDFVVRRFGAWNDSIQDGIFDKSWAERTHYIIQISGQSVGYTCVETRPASIHIREFVIHPDHQGCGLGNAVLLIIQADATAKCLPILLGVFDDNRAVNLYRRCGFKEYDRTPSHILMKWIPVE